MLSEKTKKSSKVLGSKQKDLIELQFNHVLNWKFTEIAIEEYLYHIGYKGQHVAKQQYVADMIMFMERSFKGKYLNCEDSHYQFISPSKPVPNGDSLCEKLKRCRHKNSFRKRFDIVGKTEIKTARFFTEPLTFDGMLYLRVVDTNNGNISYFYRNDKLVDDFIAKAIAFKKESMQSVLEKVGSRVDRKYAVVKVESVQSLSNTNTIQEDNKKTVHDKPAVYEASLGGEPKGFVEEEKNNSDLRNIPSYGTLGFTYSTKNVGTLKITYTTGISMAKSSFKGTGSYTAADALEDTMIEEVGNYASYTQVTKAGTRELTGLGVFKIWRDAIAVHKLSSTFIRYNAITSKKKVEAGIELFRTYLSVGNPATEFPQFMDTIMRDWPDLQDYLKDRTTWKKFDDYPNLGWLLELADKVLDWYAEKREVLKIKAEKQKAKAAEIAAKAESLQKETLNVPNIPLQNAEPIVQLQKVVKDKKATHSLGYTYMGSGFKYDKYGKENPTYEQNYVDAKQSGDTWMINMALEGLKKNTLDLNASMTRIEALLAETSND